MLSTHALRKSIPVWMGTVVLIQACARTGVTPAPIPSILAPPDGEFLQISSYDTTGGNADRLEIAPRDSAVLLDVRGPGEIRRLWITVASRDSDYLRRISLRMYWDDETDPSVAVPLGDFFGNGFDKRHYTALPMGVSSGGFYSYIPMPFGRRARIVVDNGTGLPIDAFYYNVDLIKLPRPRAPLWTFHAWWHRERRTVVGHPHLVLSARGTGAFVGMSLNAESYNNQLWFLEGDEIYHVDGTFRGQGTGTEDYFNSGWYFDRGEYAAPFHGLVVKDEDRGRIAAYRWQLADPVPFRDSILVEIEHGHANEEVADYATVAYWYQAEPHAPLPSLPPPDERRVLGVKIPPDAVLRDRFQVSGTPERPVVMVPVPRPDRYTVVVYPIGGPGVSGVVYHAGDAPPQAVDLSTSEAATLLDPVVLGEAAADSAVRVTLSGRVPPLPAAIDVRPVRRWARQWMVVGPFPNPHVLGSERSSAIDSVYGPERDPQLDTYPLVSGGVARWKPVEADDDGQIRLNPHYQPNDWVAVYARAYLYSPSVRDAILLLGADDAHALWVNGVRVSERQGRHVSEPDDVAVPIRLRAGWNLVLLEVADLDGGWAFQVRVADPFGELRWSVAATGEGGDK